MSDIIQRIARVIEERRSADPGQSYVARLHAGGIDAMCKKVGEEATEVVIAAMGGDARSVVHETADLWFHTLVLLDGCGIDHAEVLGELERRFGTSGLSEKAARKSAC